MGAGTPNRPQRSSRRCGPATFRPRGPDVKPSEVVLPHWMPKQVTPACRRCRSDEAGMAMIMAILISTILLLLPIGLAQATVGQLPLARHDQDSAAALAAAEAGADDYLNRLDSNLSYWQTSVPAVTPFNCPSASACQPSPP